MTDELTPLYGKPRRKKFLVLDIESKDGPTERAGLTRPFMVGVYDGKDYFPFFNRDKKGDWRERHFFEGGCVDLAMRHVLQRSYRGHHVYAHNGGRFDYLHLMPWLMHEGEKLGFMFRVVPVSSSIQVLDVWKTSRFRKEGPVLRHQMVRFLDSMKLMPAGLDVIAKTFGFSGKEKFNLHTNEHDPGWVPYNRTDCVELYQVLEKFHHYVENVLLGEVGITAPSTAMRILRRNYMKRPLPRTKESHAFIRESYVGGRVEPFEREGKNLRYYDFNSSYPSVMREPMPAGDGLRWEGKPPKWLWDRRVGFVRANVWVPPELDPPPLPIRGSSVQKDLATHHELATRSLAAEPPAPPQVVPKRLLFPTGKLHGVWEYDELMMAVEYGAVINEWFESWWYEPVWLFREFVEDLYRYRDKSRPDYDPGLDSVVKNMLNASYGKFGQRTVRTRIYRWDDPELPDSGARPCDGDTECPVWYAEEESDAPYIMPQIAARVTALARVKLYRAMRHVKALGGKVYYVDTDSIVTDIVLPTGTELGALKDEFPEHSGELEGEFIGPKVYILRAPGFLKVKAKGVHVDRDLDLSPTEALRKRELDLLSKVRTLSEGGTIYHSRLDKIGTLARERFSRGPLVKRVPRTLREELGKRQMNEDGSTSAYYVEMW